jgi:ABC-type branched-subunit amino acid transport system ATPase component
MLELQKVSKWFGGLPALQDVSFQMKPGTGHGPYRPQRGR